MTPEVWSAVGSIVSAVVITATAIAALIQLRHMRAGNAINAMLALRASFSNPVFINAMELLLDGSLAKAMQDPLYRAYITRKAPAPSEMAVKINQALLHVANWYEVLGSMVLQKIVTMGSVADNYAGIVKTAWDLCEPQILYLRAHMNDDAVFESFEYLTVVSIKWVEEHPSVYPANVPRLNHRSPYLTECEPKPTTASPIAPSR
ncbi:MAG: DUF4760 domain-containing protein [Candidatus Eremiobacteraeota bacterium]|nr:DUF4760 domain-containing protein [Candidatus Eremiobacteraeota bacterium]